VKKRNQNETSLQGTDITEAFEGYHIKTIASQVLQKYYVRDAVEPRNYKLTFDDDGFYRTLKRRAAAKLSTIDKSVLWKSKLILDAIVFGVFTTAVLTIRSDSLIASIIWGLLSSLLLGWLNGASHNFIHQRNNYRMYTADLVLTGWREWRVYHGLVRFQDF
jgi:hypothetical protein